MIDSNVGDFKALCQRMRQLALHRCKCKNPIRISFDDEIHCAVAEIAYTIKYHDMPVIHMPL